MRTTEILTDEHRVIERVLLCLEKMSDEFDAKSALDLEPARDAIAFLRTFADGCHHKKEEDRLFPAMERCGMPREMGPTAVMRQEHEIGRGFIGRMDAAVTAFEKGDAAAVAKFTAAARGFVELLREHIAKEEQVLFPMADRMLSDAMQDELLRGFDHAEQHEMGAGTHEKFLALADRLAARYGVTAAQAQGKAHTCSCSHGH